MEWREKSTLRFFLPSPPPSINLRLKVKNGQCLQKYSRMKVLLALGVVLTVSVALSSAQCYVGKPKFDWKTRTAVCEHMGKPYLIGEVWTANCERCSCGKESMGCCSMTNTPKFDKQICEAKFNEESCSYTVTKKDNPSEECEITGMVG
ncbi:beta-microseminoprotein-like [Phyllobates terribilis]|uniref:beta-microseminoprotein-like n=1 Tax=Phyllobates terribilis TaxID=111132 RepID=UPI003CCAA180